MAADTQRNQNLIENFLLTHDDAVDLAEDAFPYDVEPLDTPLELSSI
jgi:hypothetical protein